MPDSSTLIIEGPVNLLTLLEGEIDELDLDKDIKYYKKTFRIPPTQNLYIIYFNSMFSRTLMNNSTLDDNYKLYEKIKMEIENADPKAVVKSSQYMTGQIENIGNYLFIIHSGQDKCYDVLNKIINY